MARTITSSVGRMGANRQRDVGTVQQLLNRVPPGSGRPTTLLVEDFLCGPKTINAIQRFQIHHFGWSGADGRVDPGRQTIDRLNDFDYPLPTPPGVEPLTHRSVLMCPHGGRVKAVPVTPPTSPSVVLKADDRFIVTGCSCLRGPGVLSPCVTVLWLTTSPSATLTRLTVNFCLSAEQAMQGSVIVVRP